jgi:hypothetical protein
LDAFRSLVEGVSESSAANKPTATEDVPPMSTRAFISSGEIGTLPLEELPTEVAPSLPDDAEEEPVELAKSESEHSAGPAEDSTATTNSSASDGAGTRAPVVATAAQAVPETRRKAWLPLVAGAIALAGIAYVFALQGQETGSNRTVSETDAMPTAPEPQPSETAAPVEPSAEAAPSADATASTPPPPRVTPTPPRPVPESATSASASASAEAEGPPPFNRFVNERLVQQRAGVAKRLCARHVGPRVIPVTLRFGNDGRVKAVDMPSNVAHTGTGTCVKLHLQNVTVPKFSGPEESVKLWVNLD